MDSCLDPCLDPRPAQQTCTTNAPATSENPAPGRPTSRTSVRSVGGSGDLRGLGCQGLWRFGVWKDFGGWCWGYWGSWVLEIYNVETMKSWNACANASCYNSECKACQTAELFSVIKQQAYNAWIAVLVTVSDFVRKLTATGVSPVL